MNEKQFTVLVTEGSDPEPLRWLREQAHVIECSSQASSFADHLREADGMIVRTYTRVDDALLSGAPRLRVVGRGGVGLENIDVAACRRRGVEVVYTPDANTLAVGDYVFGYMLQLLRPWCAMGSSGYEAAEFKRIRNTVRGRQLNELTLGILGMGRVGRRVGSIGAKGFGMRVIYNDLLHVQQELNFPATAVDKPTLYREADILTIHVDMKPGNTNLVGNDEIAMMKASSILINTSRGEVLDASALASAIKGGRLQGAALDVFHPEPPPAGYPLLGLPNVILTPHIAARTSTAMANMSWVVKDIMNVLNGIKPVYPAPAA